MEMFKNMFDFKPKHAFKVGCEREAFVVNDSGLIVLQTKRALEILNDPAFGYELSACQIESRVGPVDISNLERELSIQQAYMADRLIEVGLNVNYLTIASESMPLDVYPDPTGRYQKLVQHMPREVLLAACRVAGTHIHVGMPDFETALRIDNFVVNSVEDLICLGNLTDGQRHKIYKQMAPDCMPIRYKNLSHMHEYYVENGFDTDPRRCWHFIRISVHGTIEFRMFDNTDSPALIYTWASKCLNLCRKA